MGVAYVPSETLVADLAIGDQPAMKTVNPKASLHAIEPEIN